MQYGIRLRNETDMSWGEFCTLLNGIMPKTPLGQIISIRSEENEEELKNFTNEQHKIRNEWRAKLMEKQHKVIENMSEEDKVVQVNMIQEIFKKAFS